MNEKTIEIVNQKIISALEAGINPWQKTWRQIRDFGLPYNLASKTNYNGANLILLSLQDGLECNAWVTFRQAQALGGNVKRGSKATPVVFWKWLEIEDKASGKAKRVPFLRYSNVFNALRDCEGLEGKSAEKIEESTPETVISEYIDREGIDLMHGGNRACYRPGSDMIQMPHEQAFIARDSYQSILAHECIHSTGHKTRLDRLVKTAAFGSADYGFEELIAETGACYLCALIGIEPDFNNTAAYLDSWLKALTEHKDWFVKASSKARKAVDYILNGKQ